MKFPCEVCGKPVGRAGFAQFQHMMKHVREGKARRILETRIGNRPSRWGFIPVRSTPNKFYHLRTDDGRWVTRLSTPRVTTKGRRSARSFPGGVTLDNLLYHDTSLEAVEVSR